MINFLTKNFQIHYSTKEQPFIFFAPGRVNIIGEHIDYNGGNVLPFAIEMGTYAAVVVRDDKKINLYSSNFDTSVSVELFDIKYNTKYGWANYPLGVIQTLINSGYKIDKGLDVYIYGNLPNQAGLSSSASIELLTATMLKNIFHLDIDRTQMAVLCQKAENQFMGLNCGIMDQFAISWGKKNHAIFLNTQTLNFSHIPMQLGNYCFVVTNTNKKRQLVDSAYNKRLEECSFALTILQKKFDINYLCQLSFEDFEKNRNIFDDQTILKRAKHSITEQQRTKEAIDALKLGNIKKLGRLLNESHNSLKNDYEVSCFELDTLQSLALEADGVAGARMTGAGFGGCTISLVEKNNVDNFINFVGKKYQEKTALKADFYVVNSADGANKIL